MQDNRRPTVWSDGRLNLVKLLICALAPAIIVTVTVVIAMRYQILIDDGVAVTRFRPFLMLFIPRLWLVFTLIVLFAASVLAAWGSTDHKWSRIVLTILIVGSVHAVCWPLGAVMTIVGVFRF